MSFWKRRFGMSQKRWGLVLSSLLQLTRQFDFDEWSDSNRMIHYCFRVSQDDFNVILERIRAAGIAYRNNVPAPVDSRIDTQLGGSIMLMR